MDRLAAAPHPPDPDAVEFVRFCYRRRRVGWPDLYDEMCAVANRGLFRGLGVDELAAIGIRLSLFELTTLASMACRIVAEEQALRRPVAVAVKVEPDLPVPVMAVPVATTEPTPIRRELERETTEKVAEAPRRFLAAAAGA
jgi:hypothetical protein